VFIELLSGLVPEIVSPSQQFVTTAVLGGGMYARLAELKWSHSFLPLTLIAARCVRIPRSCCAGALAVDRAVRRLSRRLGDRAARVNAV
jgi:hypothetical protein